VIAHRGIKITKVGALWTDLVSVEFEKYVPQIRSASTFANKVVEVLQAVSRNKVVKVQVFCTGPL
jgi:hypothetical protein